MASEKREYELILYGATGYTGEYTAEYIQQNAPTDLKWAIAGRNSSKLNTILTKLKSQNPDRLQPGIEVIQHNTAEITSLAKKAKVLISAVGPYALHGTPVVEACAKAGTHYLDVTGEVPWVYDMVNKYHETAKANKTALILQCGFDSVPSDMLTYVLVKHVREKYGEGLVSVVNSIQKISGGFSGGTIASAMNLYETYPAGFLLKSVAPFALSPVKPSQEQLSHEPRNDLRAWVLGSYNVKDLGVLTTYPGTIMDRSIVHRSWGLFNAGAYYGKKFKFTALLKAKNTFAGTLQHYALTGLSILMMLPPGRWLLRKFVEAPGSGPGREASSKFFCKIKGVATTESGRRLAATLELKNSLYYYTGLFVTEAALEILRGSGGKAVRDGGVVTSATLEDGYVDRLEKAGVSVKIEELPDRAKL